MPNFVGDLGCLELCKPKAHPRLPNTSQYKVWPELQGQIMAPQFDPIFWWVRVDPGCRNGINRNAIPAFIFDFNIHNRPILLRFVTIHNAADIRQTAIGIGHLGYSIGGLIMTW